jgi:hypothetical protein
MTTEDLAGDHERPAGRPRRTPSGDEVRGLSFAATELEVHVSFDDGDHWQSLRLNMPRHRRDLIVMTTTRGRHHGGAFDPDDITPLLDAAAMSAAAVVFKPQVATRVR